MSLFFQNVFTYMPTTRFQNPLYAYRHETRQYHRNFIRNLKSFIINKFSSLRSQNSVAWTWSRLHASHSRARCQAGAWDLLISSKINLEGLCSPFGILFTIRRGSFHSLKRLGCEAYQSPFCRLRNCRITHLLPSMPHCMDGDKVNFI
jgi:hypothetical protein